MKKSSGVFLTLLVVFSLKAKAQENLPLKLITTTPLPDLVGDLEFFAPDLKGNRLFLCAENSGRVEVFNLRTGKRIRSITGFEEPHDIVYLPDTNKFIVTDGVVEAEKAGHDRGWVKLISGKSYEVVDKIKLPPAVDEAVFDPVNKYFYVESASREPGGKTHLINIIDTVSFKLIGEITLPGSHSEAMAIDHSGGKLYVNNGGAREVAVVDLRTRQVIARWSVTGGEDQTALALDGKNHRLFISTRKPPKFFVFDTDTGKLVTTLPCTGVSDHMIFEAARKRIYVFGTETASVFEERDADHYEHTEVPTGYRAKTSLFVPELNRMYVALSGKEKPEAKLAIQIYQVQP
jgi:DNA-binding beta-propeller fold protein YncE